MLRSYQQKAVGCIMSDISKPGASLVVMPTASGKSHVIAGAAKLVDTVLILQPSRELLEQNREKLLRFVPADQVGTFSASFNLREIKTFTFATIQSVYNKPELFKHIKLVFLDECHNLAPRALDSMYTSFLAAIGSPKVIGLTATPFRNEIGYFRYPTGELEATTMLKLINRMRHKDAKEMFWKRIIYKINYKTLLEQGYLSPIEYIHEPLMPYAEIPVNVSRSDYNLESYTEAIVGRESVILSTISEAQNRYKALLVFCATTEQARHLSEVIVGSAMVSAKTPPKEREQTTEDFKKGKIKTIFNVNCLTTGFDKPDLDCVILLRPTRSPLLYVQMLGRLSRVAEGKTHGTVIDLTGTCKSFGGIESFELYLNPRGLWDLRTGKHPTFHDRVLFSRIV